MAYEPTVYNNGTPPNLSAANLNKSENQLKSISDKVDGIESGADVTDKANVATAIESGTATATPADTDKLPGVKSDHSLLYYTFANLWAWIIGKIEAATATTTPNDTDVVPGVNAAHAGLKYTWADLKVALATAFKHGGSNEIATATPGANVIPKAGADSKLAAGFIPQATTGAIGGSLLGASGGAVKLTNMPDGATAIYSQDAWETIAGWNLVNSTASFPTPGRVRLTWNGTGSYFGISKIIAVPAGYMVLIKLKFNSGSGQYVIHWTDGINNGILYGTCFTTDVVLNGLGTAKPMTGINIYKSSNLLAGDYIDIDWIWIGNYTYLKGSLSEEAARIANLRGDMPGVGVYASQTITATNLATAGKGDTIGGKKYTYVTALTASPGVEGEILKEATKEAELENMNLAISEIDRTNNGTKYWAAAVHPLVSSARVGAILTLTAKINNGPENTITIACESGTNHTAGGATLLGGYTDSAAKTIAEVQNNIAASGTRPAAAMIEYTNTALAGYENTIDVAAGATFTLPANGTFIWAVNGYGATINSLKKGTSAGGTTLTVAGANSSVWYRRSLA